MRIAAQAKAGYYPTPPEVVALLRQLVRFPDTSFAALDPCCGTGAALADLVDGTAGVSYGVEIDEHRAGEARQRLQRVIAAPFETCRIAANSFSLLWLNPPYDQVTADEEQTLLRMEYAFLASASRLLIAGGLLVYIIPQHLLRRREVADFLAYRFDHLRVGAFPAAVNQYQQVVVLGQRLRTGVRRADLRDWLRDLASQDAGHQALPELPLLAGMDVVEDPIPVPPSPFEVRPFLSNRPSPSDLYQEAAASELWRGVRRTTEVPPVGIVRDRPPMTLRAGHLPLLVAGGAFNGVVGEGEEQHLAKGTVRYETVTSEEELEDGRMEYRETRIPRVSVAILTGNGEIRRLV